MSETPQFGTAEYQEQIGISRCKTCDQPIVGQYYRVSGAMTCAACAQSTAGQSRPDTNQAFARGVLFGIGGALVGLILYSAVGIITGLEIGYVSLAVGYLVGRAMMKGSLGIGGRRYQIAAVILTYAAVSLSAVPIAISQFRKQANQLKTTANGADQTKLDSTTSDETKVGLFAALGYLLLIGFASPLLNLAEPLHGLIGLVILYVGIQIAWRITNGTKIQITGPFKA
jgi:hypothetical protein